MERVDSNQSDNLETLEDQTDLLDIIEDISTHEVFLKPLLNPEFLNFRLLTDTMEYSLSESQVLAPLLGGSLLEKFPYMPGGSLLSRDQEVRSSMLEIENPEQVSFDIIESTTHRRSSVILDSSKRTPILLTISSFRSEEVEDLQYKEEPRRDISDINCGCSHCILL